MLLNSQATIEDLDSVDDEMIVINKLIAIGKKNSKNILIHIDEMMKKIMNQLNCIQDLKKLMWTIFTSFLSDGSINSIDKLKQFGLIKKSALSHGFLEKVDALRAKRIKSKGFGLIQT